MSVSQVSKHMSAISAAGKFIISSGHNGLDSFRKQAKLVRKLYK